MAEPLRFYTNHPTEGMKDGTEVSSGTELSPISVKLDASRGEEKAVKCAVRCESGMRVDGALTIRFVGERKNRWKAAADEAYTEDDVLAFAQWEDAVTLENVGDTNRIFWVKAACSEDETPQNDTSVDIEATGVIVSN